ncbi:hypothetical protein GCM10025867_04600 [Frondihabitans sucicola]|uniref:DUF1648 domain-containing protein n=1 Tax=Frondihabitans sucicola TaxID=1268041 RepID=A0ABM8GIK9_9MICO|nr:hypothetical protein GCM10025867_04600 [Frondihabitans sucicola]
MIAVLLAAPVAVIVVTAVHWWGRLPHRTASHWNSQGRVDGYTATWELLAGCLIVPILAVVLAMVFLNDARLPADAALPVILAGTFSGMACSAWIVIAGASLPSGMILSGASAPLSVVGIFYGLPVWAAVGRAHPQKAPNQSTTRVGHRDCPSHWGGWGYRILPGKRGIILHSGPGLVITRLDGRLFAVTVKSPERGVTLLRELMNETR